MSLKILTDPEAELQKKKKQNKKTWLCNTQMTITTALQVPTDSCIKEGTIPNAFH